MKKILFYCQNLLGLGHLVRTTELIRELATTFQICLIDGGQRVAGFTLPEGIEVIQLPTLQVEVSDSSVSKTLCVVGSSMSLEEVKTFRAKSLIQVFEQFQPDCLITEGYPFSKHKALAFEMIPFLDHVKSAEHPPKIICSLRDIVMVKEFADRDFEERRRCQFANQYYDGILFHSDPAIHRLEDNISRASELTCPHYYTGYVVQSEPEGIETNPDDAILLNDPNPMIVVSVGGGKLGLDLLESTIQAAAFLKDKTPHQIVVFAGPLMEDEQYEQLQVLAEGQSNLVLRRFTPHLISYLKKADLSISLGGYNTTMNILKTGIRALIYPSNKDREQAIRAEKLERIGLLKILFPSELRPERLSQTIVNYLAKSPTHQDHQLQLEGANESSEILKILLQPSLVAA